MKILEAKRRVTWLWRLATSGFRPEHAGEIEALWVFDTIHQPDGAVLRDHVQTVAARARLNLRSFGPLRSSVSRLPSSVLRFVVSLRCVLDKDFDGALARRIVDATAPANYRVLVVGACKGTFARALLHQTSAFEVWEVQHGLLDHSYFPMRANRFYARSSNSANIIRHRDPGAYVEQLDSSLDPPEGQLLALGDSPIEEVVCLSKNPGGGCTSGELVVFERACHAMACRLGSRFCMQLHPRDNVLKLLARHRRLDALRWLTRSRADAAHRRRVVVSAYSSALVARSLTGDRLLNVRIGHPDAVVLQEYAWLPTIDIQALCLLDSTSYAFHRGE